MGQGTKHSCACDLSTGKESAHEKYRGEVLRVGILRHRKISTYCKPRVFSSDRFFINMNKLGVTSASDAQCGAQMTRSLFQTKLLFKA